MQRHLLRLSLLLLLTSCSRGAPDDILLLQGEAEPGETLVLSRRSAAFCSEATGEPFETFTELARTTTDPSGAFTFEIYRAQSAPGAGADACFRVQSAEDARTDVVTVLQGDDARLPALPRWDATPEWTGEGWRAPAAPALPKGSLMNDELFEWQLNSEAGPLWRASIATDLVLPSELHEDFGAGTLQAFARARYFDYDDELGIFFATHTFGVFNVRTHAVVLQPDVPSFTPLSRGAECWSDEVALTPCPATDGQLAAASLATDAYEPPSALELRWAQVRPLRKLVLRGFEGYGDPLRVEIATDEGDWAVAAEFWAEPMSEPFMATLGQWRTLELGGVPGNRLRIVATDGYLLGVRELSVLE